MNTTTHNRIKIKIRRGDMIRVLRGKDRGKVAQILAVIPETSRVLVEGVNMIKKHVRPKRAGEKGQRVTIASPVHIASVQLVCPSCKKGARIGIRRSADGRERICKRCGEVIPVKK